MRSRPTVRGISCPPAHPGDELNVDVFLESGSDTPIEEIELLLQGQELANGGKNGPHAVRELGPWKAQLARTGALSKGQHHYRAVFRLPPDAPPTYPGKTISVEYWFRLHVDIPWWPDLDRRYSLHVLPLPSARPQRAPITETTATGAADPFLEVTIDDRYFSPGDMLTGAIAVGNLKGKVPRRIEMAIVGKESLIGGWLGFPYVGEAARYVVHFPPESVGDGRELPFRIALARDMAPSFLTPATTLGWSLVTKVVMPWGHDIVHVAPLVIAPLVGQAAEAPRRTHLGEPRWRAVWTSAAASIGLRLHDEELSLEGEIAGQPARVFVDDESDTPAIAGELSWPSWGIGAAVHARSIGLFAADDGDGFGKKYRVDAREPAQAKAVLVQSLRRALLAFDDVYLDDSHVRVRRKVPAFDHVALVAEPLAVLAHELAAARARIPPPAAMATAVPAWQAAALDWRATLELGSMSLVGGRREGARFDVETRWDGDKPEHTAVTLTLDPPLDSEVSIDEAAEKTLGKVGHDALTYLRKEGSISLHRESLEVASEGPTVDPAALDDRMDAMLTLARALHGQRAGGPYR